jgi:hypothetical protein
MKAKMREFGKWLLATIIAEVVAEMAKRAKEKGVGLDGL